MVAREHEQAKANSVMQGLGCCDDDVMRFQNLNYFQNFVVAVVAVVATKDFVVVVVVEMRVQLVGVSGVRPLTMVLFLP